MKLITIVGAHKVIDDLANTNEIGAHLAYWMTKFVIATQSEFEFYQESLRKLFEKYGVEKTDTGITVAEEHRDKLLEEIAKLDDTDAQDPGIRFSLAELSKELKISPKQMFYLMDFIDEDEG